MIRSLLLFAALVVASTPLVAEEDAARQSFIESNLLATYYHELGHALIDAFQLPVLGREEDAVDALSTLLVHDIWEEESATEMMRDVSYGWLWSDARSTEEGYEPAYWDSHSLDLQRHYTQLCLFYGADPEQRAALLEEFELPEERAEGCAEEYGLAAGSWDAMLEGLKEPDTGRLMLVRGPEGAEYRQLIADEISDFNRDYNLPMNIDVAIETCGEANAFYDPSLRRITLCTEYAEDIGALWDAN